MTEDEQVEQLVGEALDASQRGDVEEARRLAGEALRHRPLHPDALEIARLGDRSPAELRRLTILFCDLVGSTAMSIRHQPGEYGRMIEQYHRHCEDVIDANGGRVTRRVGDGVLALFGHPVSFGDDTRRAVRAGLAIIDRMGAIAADLERDVGERFEVRIAVHHGLVHLDLVESQIYGLAPNLAARLQELAPPNGLVVSAQVVALVGELFDMVAKDPVELRGLDGPLDYAVVLGERPETPRRGRAWAAPFVGRLEERDRIRQFVDPGASPDHPMMVVRGEPGIGKSRLVDEALSGTTAPPKRILSAVCSPYGQAHEFGAVAGLLRLHPATADERPGARLRQLTADIGELGLSATDLLPLLGPVVGLEPSDGFERVESDLSRIRALTVDAIRSWIGAAAANGGLVVLIDDLQWADPASMRVLLGLATSPLAGVRVLTTMRNDHPIDLPAAAEIIDVGPLGATSSLELVMQAAPGITRNHVDRVLAQGHGIPLFLEELAQGPETEVAAVIDRSLLSEPSGVPDVLYEPLVARLARPDVDLRLAQIAATIGVGFDLRTVSAVAARSTERVRQGLTALQSAGVVVDGADGTFRFRHSLVRDLAYDLQTIEDRQDTHGRVGRALRDTGGDVPRASWTVIAHHLHTSHDYPGAIDAYVHAAEETRDLGGLESARSMLDTALDLIGELDPVDERRLLEVTTRLQRAFLSVTLAGNADPGARADYDACEKLLHDHAPGPEFVDTLVSLWGYHTARGSLGRADRLLDEIRATGVCDDPRHDAENKGARGLILFLRGEYAEAQRLFAEAAAVRPPDAEMDLRPSRWQFPNDPITVDHAFRGALAWQLGDMTECRAQQRAARHRAQRLTFPYGPFSLCYALHYEIWVHLETGELELAAAGLDELMALAARHGFDFWSISAGALHSTVACEVELRNGAPDLGVLEQEMTRQDNVRSVISMIDSRAFLPFGLTRQAAAAIACGDTERAGSLLDQAEAVAERTGSRFYLAETWRTRAAVLRRNDPARADHALGEALRIAQAQGAVVFARRAEADRRDLDGACGDGA